MDSRKCDGLGNREKGSVVGKAKWAAPVALVLLLTIAWPALGQDARQRYYPLEMNDSYFEVLNLDSQSNYAGGVRIWTTAIYFEEQTGPNLPKFAYFTNYNEVECASLRYRSLSTILRDANFALTGSDATPGSWAYAEPGTNGARLVNLACGKETAVPDGILLGTLPTIRAAILKVRAEG